MRGSFIIALCISTCLFALVYATFAIISYEKPVEEKQEYSEDGYMNAHMLYMRYKHSTQPYQKDTTIIFTEEDSILSSY